MEDHVLEELCFGTGMEPDVPADQMKSRDVMKLIRKISTSEALAGVSNAEKEAIGIENQTTSSASSMGSAPNRPASNTNKRAPSLTRPDVASLEEILRSISEM
uniref:Uncharacterized protein n=1 Tax=Ciona savignyi TaxID=51511 RepID=H2Z9T8_CIOSA